jgi:hypothetical protein
LNFAISPKKLALGFTLVVLSLIVAHVCVQDLKFFLGHDTQLGFERQFNLERENNIPTWYSSFALLLSAMLLGIIGLAISVRGIPTPFIGSAWRLSFSTCLLMKRRVFMKT